MILIKLLVVNLLIYFQVVDAFTFNEELLVENLPDSHVHLHFQFTSTWDKSNNNEEKGLIDFSIIQLTLEFLIKLSPSFISQKLWPLSKTPR